MHAKTSIARQGWEPELKSFALGEIYELEPGHFHSVGHLPSGSIPIVSCGDYDDGVLGYFDVGNAPTFSDRITIAFNGENPLTAKYHPYRFAAGVHPDPSGRLGI